MEVTSTPMPRAPRTRRNARLLLYAIVALLGSVIAISLFGRPVYPVGPFSIRVTMSPAVSGRTAVMLPPLGSVSAKTHFSPLRVQMTVEDARLEDLRALAVELPHKKVLVKRLRAEVTRAVASFAVIALMLSFVGAAAAALAVFRPLSCRRAVLAGVFATAVTGILLGVTGATYDLDALRQSPTYSGALRGAPIIAKLIGSGLLKVGEVDSGVQNATASLSHLYDELNEMDSTRMPDGLSRILVISDIHNNTIAIRWAASLAKAFNADMVLDAGDLTDLGTHFETQLAEQVRRIPGPHVFVPGNHDSAEILQALKKTGNTISPRNSEVTVKGLKVLCFDDPASVHHGKREIVPSYREILSTRNRIGRLLARGERPDILLVHSDEIARPFIGRIPIVAYGHSHHVTIDKGSHGVGINPGSTGASGMRFFQSSMPKAMSAVVIYVARTPRPHAVAADVVEITSPVGEFRVTRHRL
jgi:predicted phosphodiesterase